MCAFRVKRSFSALSPCLLMAQNGYRRKLCSPPGPLAPEEFLNIAPLSLYDHFKAAIDHALAVKGHGIGFGLQAWIAHDFLHALIPHTARGPNDPGKHDRLVVLTLNGHWERREFPVG